MNVVKGITTLVLLGVLGFSEVAAQPKTRTCGASLFVSDEVTVLRCGTSGRYLLPLTVEGPFPRYAIGATIFLYGPGRKDSGGANSIYDFGGSAWDTYDSIRAGTVSVSTDHKHVRISPTQTDGRWSSALTGSFDVQKVYPVISGAAADFYLRLYRMTADEVVKTGLRDKAHLSGIPVGDMVVSFLFNTRAAEFPLSSACGQRGVLILWDGDKGREVDILSVPEAERIAILEQLATQKLATPYADAWEAKRATATRGTAR